MRSAACSLVLTLLLAGAAAAAAEEASAPNQSEYSIGVEDVLHVSVWGEPAIDLSVPVRPDGRISLPLVNDIAVAGRTPSEVRREITERLAKFIRDPEVTVVVEQINSFRVSVLGEVNQQGVFSFRRPTRLLQAIAAAGGLTKFSNKKIVLSRSAYGELQVLEIDLKRLLRGEDLSLNVFLMPEDIILVN